MSETHAPAGSVIALLERCHTDLLALRKDITSQIDGGDMLRDTVLSDLAGVGELIRVALHQAKNDRNRDLYKLDVWSA